VKIIAAFSVLLIIVSAQAGDIIRDKSPDGKFALRITKEEEVWSAAIIDLKGKDAVVELEIYQNQSDVFIKQAHLVWSKDSQRVAYFEPDRRGGGTAVYFRKDRDFELVELPGLPECKKPAPKEGESHVKTIEETTAPQKWLSSGALVLKIRLDDLMENERGQFGQPCTQIITIEFDSSHKASVQSAKQVKIDR